MKARQFLLMLHYLRGGKDLNASLMLDRLSLILSLKKSIISQS